MPDTPDDIEYGRTTAWERIAREEERPEGEAQGKDKPRRRTFGSRVSRLIRPLTARVRRSA
jgi:hypothetical protein